MEKDMTAYRAAAYLRISKEDGDKAESDSIANQRDLIRRFLCGRPEIHLAGERIDDGYSGATFDRPSFKRMLAEIEAGQLNCVIVKDLSRFGRNFVEAGRYIDQIFPALGVRFIAVNDNYDSAQGRSQSDNVLLPFLNLVNDMFCRDISIKVRSQLEIKRQKGEFIGSFAVYGYRKDPQDRHRLLVDDAAADIVRAIFQWKLEGMSQQKIADRLNGLGVLSPLEHKRSRGLDYRCGFQANPKARWSAIAVGRILQNECYTGTLVQGKRTTPNHKVKKTVEKPPAEWVRVENCHPPVVSREDFQIVQRLLALDTRIAPRQQTVSLFSGLLFCGGCRQSMVKNSVYKNGRVYVYYVCGTHRMHKGCSSHRIPEQLVYGAVRASLQQQLSSFLPPETAQGLKAAPSRRAMARRSAILRELQGEAERCKRFKSALCDALADGILGEADCRRMKAVYDRRQREAETAYANLCGEGTLLCRDGPAADGQADPCEGERSAAWLDRRMAVTFIEEILVYEDNRLHIRFRYQDGCRPALGQAEQAGTCAGQAKGAV